MNTKIKTLLLGSLALLGLASCTKLEPKLLKADGEWDIVRRAVITTVNDTLQSNTVETDNLGYLAFEDDYEGVQYDYKGDTVTWFTWSIDEDLEKLRFTTPHLGFEVIYDVLELSKGKMELHGLHTDITPTTVTEEDITMSLERR